MKRTANLGLNKPEYGDVYDIAHMNENMDILDDVILKHIENQNNPHVVVADQAGAVSLDGSRAMTGTLQKMVNGTKYDYYGAFNHELMAKTFPQIMNITSNDGDPDPQDMDELLKTNVGVKCYFTNRNTLGTPYKYGKTSCAIAYIMQFYGGSFGHQTAFLSGGHIMVRYINNGTISEWDGYLPFKGGTMHDQITFDNDNSYFAITKKRILNNVEHKMTLGVLATEGATTLEKYTGGNLQSRFKLLEDKLQIEKVGIGTYELYGQHNKPKGTYTGNGSSTQRTVNIGGIGACCLIRVTTHNVLATSGGAFCWNTSDGNIDTLKNSECKFENGVLTIATNVTFVNGNSVVYYYEVL